MPERYTPPEARGETRDTIDAERVAEQSRVDLSQLLQTIKQPLSKYGKGALFAGLLLGAVSEGVIQDAEAARQVRHTDNASFAGAREEVSIGARMRIERFQGLIQDFEEKIDDANQELARIQRKFAQDRTASQSKKLNATDYASLMLRKKMLRGWIKHYNNRIDTLEGKIEKVKGKHDDRQQERVERQQERGTDRAAERASVGLYKRANAEVDQWLVSANIREVGRDIIVWDVSGAPQALRLSPSERVDGFFGEQEDFVITVETIDGNYTGIHVVDGALIELFPCTERGKPIK